MFCPQCNAEYRPGFTRCADCEVDLVNEPPQYALAGQPPTAPGDPNEDPFCSFWKGEDARVHAELCEVLEEAGIPHKTVFRRDHLFNLSNFPGYQVGVPFSLFEKAEKAVQEAFDTEDAEERETLNTPRLLQSSQETIRKLPATMTPAPEENIPRATEDGRGGGLVSGRCDRECVVHRRGRAQRFPGCRSSREWDQLPRGSAGNSRQTLCLAARHRARP